MSIEHAAEPRKRLSFDPTINLGHILTALLMLATGFGAYNNLDKRLAVQEQLAAQVATQRAEKDKDFKDAIKDLGGDVKDMRRAVDDLRSTITVEKARGK